MYIKVGVCNFWEILRATLSATDSFYRRPTLDRRRRRQLFLTIRDTKLNLLVEAALMPKGDTKKKDKKAKKEKNEKEEPKPVKRKKVMVSTFSIH